jgi:PAS domain S-box-containing protein
MFDLSAFRLQDMALCSATVRQLGDGATSIEAVADRITRFLYTNLTTGPDEDPACVLVRAFKTHPYNRLTPELQALVDVSLGDKPTNLDLKCLTLLASTGAVSGWNNPALSSRFRVIPLAGPEALTQLPMFAQLLTQFHIDLPYLQDTPVSLLLDQHATTFNAFLVPQAVNSPYVPGQEDFIVPFGVQSVFGCGGLLTTGDMFAFILFSKVAVSKETADLFKTVALSAKLALAPFEHPRLILPTVTAASDARGTQKPATLTALQDRVATLEAILAVQEQTIEVQSRRLEANLAEAVRQGQQLQKQSVRFETLSATSPVGIFETDAGGACLYTNAAWQTIAGLTLADTLGDGWSRAILEEDRPAVFAGWKQSADAGRHFSLEFRMQRPDGTIRWVHARSRPLINDAGQMTGHVGTTEDITERMIAAAALRESQQQLDLAVQGSQTGIWDWDIGTNQVYFSPIWKRQLGYEPHELQGRFEEWRDRLHPDDRDHALAAVESYLAGHTSGFELECRLRHKNGSYRWILARGVSRHDGQGKPYRMAGSHVDITDRKQAEIALRLSEERYRRYFELGLIGMAVTSLDQGWVQVNDRLCKIFGYSHDELMTKTWTELTHPDDVAADVAQFNRVLAGEIDSYAMDKRFIHKDGRVIYASISASAVRREDGSIDHFVALVQDTTAEKAALQRLRETEERWTLAFEGSGDGVWDWDARTNRVFFSNRWKQMLGYAENEIGTTLDEWSSRVHPDDLDRTMADVQSHLRGETPAYVNEHRMRCTDGSYKWILDRGKVVSRTPDGSPLRVVGTHTDVTERKHTEEALRQATTVQKALLTHAGYAVIATDPAGLITVFNPAAEQLLGYTAGEMIGKQTPAVFHDRDEIAARAVEFGADLGITITTGFDVFAEKARRNLPNQYEWTYIRKDGRRIPVMLSITALRDSTDTILGYIAMALDLTDRKAADAQFQTIMEAMPTGIVLVDEAGRITMVNQHTGQMFGYAPGTLLGQPIEILLPERFRTAHPDQVQAFIKAPTARAMGAGRDLAGRRKDRSEFAVEIGLAPIHTQQGLQILASIADISLRKQTESTRFRLQQAINHAQDGMALFDEAGQFTYMNPAYASIYGHAVDDLLGKSWLQLYPEEWAAMIDQMYLPMLRSEGRWQGEVVGKKKSGDAFHVDLSLTLLEEPGTGRQTILCTCRDISLRKQMEHDLITAKEAAEAGIRAKSEFLATMSHEIRTPMNGVLGMTDLLIDTTLTSEQREFVHTLKHSGESLMRIINDILDFSKIEAGKLTIETLPFDLRTTIEYTLDLLAPTAQTKHLELVGLIDAQAPNTVIGDPGRIRQIMTNLIGNAIKFTERGEVLVQILKAEEDTSSVLLRFEIVDTGVGLTEEAKAKLFQSFTQADSSTARKYGGTGLGLTICKRLTELMGGQIGIQSFPGTGTCVWFTIRLRTQADTPSLPAPAIVESLSGLRICLIDDNATNRSLLQYHACDWKMHYESAEDGPSALALIRRAAAEGKPFDLAILDMHMPGMNGLELGRAIRAEANLNGTRLVLLTSLGRRGDAKLAHSAGFSGYLTKPIRKTHLYDCLRLVMGQAPVSHQDSQAAPAETPLITRHQVAEVTAHIRLLVVDDNLVNQKVAVKMLEKLGHRVDVASNGNEALAALTRHHYNLVFMDCQMPELDGFETTRMIRTHEKPGCHLPIVAMTANAMQGDREHCLASGMDDFVSKPVKSQDLKKVLTQWLNLSDDRAAA